MTRSTLTNFRAEDFGDAAGDKVDNLPGETTVEPEKQPDSSSSAEPSEQSDEVPTGTSKEVLAWVGDDQDRAQRAYDAELADATPRRGVLSRLEEILDKDESKE